MLLRKRTWFKKEKEKLKYIYIFFSNAFQWQLHVGHISAYCSGGKAGPNPESTLISSGTETARAEGPKEPLTFWGVGGAVHNRLISWQEPLALLRSQDFFSFTVGQQGMSTQFFSMTLDEIFGSIQN